MGGKKYMFLETMKENYLENVKINLSKGSYEFYRNHSNYIINYFLENKIFDSDQINVDVVYEFIKNEKNKEVSNATINKRILTLKLMFKNSKINCDFLNVKKLKESRNTFNVLSYSELERLNNYINSDNISLKNKLIVMLLIDTGIRRSEVVSIKVKNINFSNNTIYLDVTKSKRSRVVPFTNATSVLLKKYIESLENSDKLFNMTPSGVNSLFDRIQSKLGFNKLHPHMLRHTLSTKLHKNNVSLMIIQKVMGHQNVSTTQRYIHFDLDDVLTSYNNVMN